MSERRLIGLALIGFLVYCSDEKLNQGKPSLKVEPLELVFKTLNIGESDTRTLVLRNSGTATLKISSLTLQAEPVFEFLRLDGEDFSQVSFPLSIPPASIGQINTRALEVRFGAQQLGQYSGKMAIASNDEKQPMVEVGLSGICSVPDIDLEPALLDFGAVRLNSSSALQLTIHNRGQSDLAIASGDIRLESGAASSPFSFLAPDLRIAGSAWGNIQVIYSPKSVELDPQTHQPLPHQDRLLIFSNDPDENPAAVPLTGLVSDNLPPLVTLRIGETQTLEGKILENPCDIATSDTIRLDATVVDPEGGFLQPSNLFWSVATRPLGSQRQAVAVPGQFQATFRPDMYGDYVICLEASDPQGVRSSADPTSACTCEQANGQGAQDFFCPCVKFTAFTREDIRVELTWDFVGPDLDLHLLAPDGEFCKPTRECRFNPTQQDPSWDRFACVTMNSLTVCRTPNCDPISAGCLEGQVCFDTDDSGPEPPACWWKRCSSRDCYWDSRNPDWGIPGEEKDDPLLAIDCTHSCRAENININRPEPGIYRVAVNYYEYSGDTTATVRIFFKGDLQPSAEFTGKLTATCDTWNVALIDWTDPTTHSVTSLGDSHSSLCCK